jgi:hypothetical protein
MSGSLVSRPLIYRIAVSRELQPTAPVREAVVRMTTASGYRRIISRCPRRERRTVRDRPARAIRLCSVTCPIAVSRGRPPTPHECESVGRLATAFVDSELRKLGGLPTF